jgi:hypothetical protein
VRLCRATLPQRKCQRCRESRHVVNFYVNTAPVSRSLTHYTLFRRASAVVNTSSSPGRSMTRRTHASTSSTRPCMGAAPPLPCVPRRRFGFPALSHGGSICRMSRKTPCVPVSILFATAWERASPSSSESWARYVGVQKWGEPYKGTKSFTDYRLQEECQVVPAFCRRRAMSVRGARTHIPPAKPGSAYEPPKAVYSYLNSLS